MSTVSNLTKRLVPPVISLTMFMETVDSTIINTAIPAMSRSLKVNPIDLKIALISYLLSLAVFIPISGWLADKFGAKRVFISAITIFTLSSIACGVSQSLVFLVIGRTVQGFGGALMMPIGRLIIIRIFGREAFLTVMARVVLIGGLGPMVGPVLGGVITHHLSWRWIFWVNIPFGLLAIYLAKHWMPDLSPQLVNPLDKWGFLLFGLGLAGVTFSLSAFSESTVSFSAGFFMMASAIGLLLLYGLRSRTQAHPIVKTSLFQYRAFRVSIIGNLVTRLGFGGVPFLLPLLLQLGLGYSAQTAGFLLAPTALGIIFVKYFSTYLLQRLKFKRLLILNTVLLGLSLVLFSLITTKTALGTIALLTFLFGLLVSLQYTGMNPLAYDKIPVTDLSAATSVLSTAQQLSQSIGVAVSALLLRYFSKVVSSIHGLTTTVFHHVFFMMGLMTILSTAIFLPLKQDDGSDMLLKK